MKVTICTTHGKPYTCAGLRLTPEEQDFDVTAEQLVTLKRAANPKAFKATDGRTIRGGRGVLRLREGGLPPKAKADDDKAPKKAEK